MAALVAEMDRRGRLTVPARTLEAHPRAADALRSLHVVVEAGGRLAFAHQSYFEYRLAARLLDDAQGGGRPVADWVRAGDQSLLRRDPLRLVLTLLRDEDHGEYVRTLRDLVLAPAGAVRFHLRQLALRVLGEAAGPTPQECELVCELAGNPAWREHVLDQVFTRQPAWLDAADDRGLVAGWLASADGPEIDLGLAVCRWWAGQRGDRVAGLVEPYRCRPDPWPGRVAGVVPFNPADDTPALFRLRLALVRAGAVRHAHLMATELAGRCPERLIDLLDAHLDRRQASPEEPAGTPADERGFPYFLPQHEVEHLERVADALPAAVWERLMPNVVRTCERTREGADERRPAPFFRDGTWPSDRLYLREPNVELLQLVARAGAWVAGGDPAGFAARHARWLDHPGRSVQRAVGLALADASEAAADLAVGWLCDDPHRLSLTDERGRRWGIAQRLIRRHADACSTEAYARLERTLLGYHEADERRSLEWHLRSVREGWMQANNYGLSQHALLPCLPAGRVSDTARSEAGVLDRKFGRPAAECIGPHSVGGLVESALRPGRAARVGDAGWLAVIRNPQIVARRGARSWVTRDGGLADVSVDGFARSLGERARLEPGRFARLALAFPAGADPAYLTGVLHAAADTTPPDAGCADWRPASDDEVRALVEHVGYREDERVAAGLCWLMRQRPAGLSTAGCLELLGRYATDHPHPAAGWVLSSNREVDHDTESMNCTRGKAVEAVGHLLFDEPCLVGVFAPALRRAAGDAHPAVRVAAVGACLPVLNADRKLAVELFLSACTGPDAMLASRWVSEFVRYSLRSHHTELGPLLRRMAGSSVPAVAITGAAWLTFGSLDGRFPADEIDGLAGGTPAQRTGVARAAAHNCDDPTVVGRCVELLARLIDDPDEPVREQAGEFVRQTGVLRSPDGRRLAAAFAAGREFGRAPSGLVEALRRHPDSLVPLAPVVEAVCVRVAGDLADPARRERLQGGYALDRFVPLILRLYEQAEQVGDVRLRAACLDWWDRLLAARMGGAAQVLADLETEVMNEP